MVIHRVHTKFLWKRAEGKYKNNAELAALKEMSVALWDWNPRHVRSGDKDPTSSDACSVIHA